ncbi:MAG: PP2C family protein-serine/threonine phosphatase, partial [Bacteroidia bacterium]
LKIVIQEKLRGDYENKTAQTLALQKVKDTRQRFILYGCIIGFILLGILLFFVWRSYRVKKKANIEILAQRDIIQEKNKEILDSIHYAKRIQDALLPDTSLLNHFFADSFVLFQPRDIVSGDFYWINEQENQFSLAVCDSTGHGVPGAFVSLLNLSFVNEAVIEKNMTDPARVFNFARSRLLERLSADSGQDGMDAVLFTFDKKENTLRYSAANIKPILIRAGAIIELEIDKMPVGKSPKEELPFQTYTMPLQSGDLLLAFTDGFADQFGGPKGKKYKYSQLHALLCANAQLPLPELKTILQNSFTDWKGNLEQLDDVLLVGMRIH